MTQFPRLSALLLISGILAVPAVVRGDTIHITSGAAVSRNELTGVPSDVFGVDVTIASADHGFSLAASGDFSGGRYDLYGECLFGSGCEPGHVHSLAMGWIGSDFPGTATADGLTFSVALASEGTGSVDAEFSGSWTAPAFTGDTTASVTAPFTFTGVVDYPGPPSDPNEPDLLPRRRDTLVGSGFATINLVWGGVNAQFGAWTYAGSRYEFTATPEPATLLLVAPLAVALVRRRSLKRATQS